MIIRKDVSTDDLVKLYLAGESGVSLSKRFNIDDAAIYKRLRRVGIQIRPRTRSILGRKFGRLTVICFDSDKSNSNYGNCAFWKCQCDCGNFLVVSAASLKSGNTKSCGCWKKQVHTVHGKYKSLELELFNYAKHRAKKSGLEFDLEPSDIKIPEFCPLLNVPIYRRDKTGEKVRKTNDLRMRRCPSLDRINPDRGYTKDNVWVISYRANTIKNNASLAELKQIASALDDKIWQMKIIQII